MSKNSYCTVIDSNFVVGAVVLKESIDRSDYRKSFRPLRPDPNTETLVEKFKGEKFQLGLQTGWRYRAPNYKPFLPGSCLEDAHRIKDKPFRISQEDRPPEKEDAPPPIPFTVIVGQNFSSMDRGFLNFYGINNIISMPDIKNPYTESGSRVHDAKTISSRYSNAFNKLHIWSLDQFDKVVYLDSDILTVRPIHHLFKVDLGMGEVGMAPDLGHKGKVGLSRWNSGVMVIRPEAALHKKLLDNILKYPSLDGGDQGYIVSFFDQSKGIKKINQSFNFLKRRWDEWAAIGRRVCNIHYVGGNKPWSDMPVPVNYRGLHKVYRTAYSSFVTDRWDRILGVELSHLNNLNKKNREEGEDGIEGGLMYRHSSKTSNLNRLDPFLETKRYKLYHLAGLPSVKTVLEIGINEGHGALIMLKADPKLKYYGFDTGEHPYVRPSVEYLKSLEYDITYIKGNSLVTVPNCAEGLYEGSPTKFDLIHIDGCHKPEAARQDILNCRRLAHEDTVIVFDDINILDEKGPPLEKMWADLIKEGVIEEIDDFNMAPQSWDSRVGKYCL